MSIDKMKIKAVYEKGIIKSICKEIKNNIKKHNRKYDYIQTDYFEDKIIINFVKIDKKKK